MNQSKKHYPLNAKQIHILKLTYKFRFITAPLLTSYKDLKSRTAMHATLKNLIDRGLLAKRFDRNTLFQNKGGRYYLTSKAMRILRDDFGISEKNLNTIFKNKSVSEKFVDQQVEVFRLYLNLRRIYPNTFDMFTRTEIASHDYFLRPTPDLYLNRLKPSKGQHNEYLLDEFLDTPLYLIKKRVDAFIDHYDSGEWEAGANTEYPTILLVCSDSSIESKIQNYTKKNLEDRGMDDEMIFLTTTLKALNSVEQRIWSNVFQPEELIPLT